MERLCRDRLPKIKGQDVLGLGEATARVLPQRVGLGFLALPEVQGTLRRERYVGVCRRSQDAQGTRGSRPCLQGLCQGPLTSMAQVPQGNASHVGQWVPTGLASLFPAPTHEPSPGQVAPPL